jgi:UDP-N-acetyl-D-mannosaminuronic acid dehydrogenase
MRTICIIGLGYIGLPTASLFATNGFHVLGVDINPKIVKTINNGNIHIDEAGLRKKVKIAVESGHLTASTRPSKADAFIIAVPTPFGRKKEPDLSYVYGAVDAIVPYLEQGNIVIVESTVPPGTADEVAVRIAKRRPDLVEKGKAKKLSVHVAHCPERVLPGNILKELVENDRVIGGLDEESSEKAHELYGKIVKGQIYVTDATTAEMVKLAENTFRDVNISLSNELAIICQRLGINVWDVIQLASKHPRVKFLSPGPGVGGHCIAVDPWFIVSEFPKESKVIRSARERNDSMPQMVVNNILRFVKDDPKPKIACLGASYKGNVGDPRNSPAIEIYSTVKKRIGKRGEVVLNDGHILDSPIPLVSLERALKGASIIVILVDHDEYNSLSPVALSKIVKNKIIYDTRCIIDVERWQQAGFDVHMIGNGHLN